MLLRQLGAPRDSNQLERAVALFLRSFVLLLLGYVCFHKLFPFGLLYVRIGEMTGADFLLLIFRTLVATAAAVYFVAKAFSHPGLARPIREGTVFLVRLTWPQASSDEAHRIAFGFSPPVTTGTLQRA
jgi:hypothetical protein